MAAMDIRNSGAADCTIVDSPADTAVGVAADGRRTSNGHCYLWRRLDRRLTPPAMACAGHGRIMPSVAQLLAAWTYDDLQTDQRRT